MVSDKANGNELKRSYDIVLASTYAEATNWNVAQARRSRQGQFGVIAEPFETWIAKIWEQHGDGRVFPSELERLAVAEAVVQKSSFSDLEKTPGLGKALSDCAKRGVGIAAFDEAVARAHAGQAPHYVADDGALIAFTPAETEFLSCVHEYCTALCQNGYIELGEALTRLSSDASSVWRRTFQVLYLGDAPLPVGQQLFFDGVSQLELSHDAVASPGRLKRADVPVVRFAFPTGRYAQPSLILQAIEDVAQRVPEGRIVVSCSGPLALYERLASALTSLGMTCSVQAGKSFSQTDFGKAFLAACEVRAGRMPWNKDALSTVLHSSIANLKKTDVWRIDAELRADRLAGKEETLDRLRGSDAQTQEGNRALFDLCSARCECFDDEALRALAEHLGQLVNAGFPASYVFEQQQAARALLDAADALKQAGCLKPSMLVNVLAQARVSLSVANYEPAAGDSARVQIMTLRRAARLGPKSASALMVCDLTTASYPLGERPSAADAVLQRLGAGEVDAALAKARREFSALVQVPCDTLVLERCLNDESANPLYPSAMWEEFVDAYREGDLSDRDDIDNRFQLPENLQEGLYERGEEDLLCDLRPEAQTSSPQFVDAGTWERSDAGALGMRVAFPADREASSGLVRLSASQIEAYLDCPYQWFVNRRLGAADLDEGIGPDKVGTFLHSLFQRFYLEFGEKVTPDNLNRARKVMFGDDGAGGLFSQLAGEQAQKRPGSRYAVVAGTTEEAELENLKARASQWLDFETTFLPGFEPVAFECAIQDVEYEGVLIRGSIDRIDINEKGQAVIIDYKGSVKDEHQAFKRKGRKGNTTASFIENGKIQAALYADIVARAGEVWSGAVACGEGMLVQRSGVGTAPEEVCQVRVFPITEVVGELYVSYSKGNKVAGAYSIEAISAAADIPTLARKTMCGLPADDLSSSFDDFIAYHRARAASAIADMRAGKVRPRPSSAGACKYCPVNTCEQRSDDESH